MGAGASAPFGLPVGSALKKQICGIGMAGDLGLNLLGTKLDWTRGIFNEFLQAFRTSGLYSIDSFLALNAKYRTPGLCAIAACLLDQERSYFLHNAAGTQFDSDWYGYLWNRMRDDVQTIDELPENKVSFVTFNYDRSLEMFLYLSIKNTFGVPDVMAFEYMKKIPIHHVYGSLGPAESHDSFRYGCQGEAVDSWGSLDMDLAVNNLKVIPMDRDYEIDGTAQKMFAQAKQLIFLGFGFDKVNCGRLGTKRMLEESKFIERVFFTSMGMTEAENWQARQLTLPANLPQAAVMLNFEGTCLQGLRDWGALF